VALDMELGLLTLILRQALQGKFYYPTVQAPQLGLAFLEALSDGCY
jgi:uncharacterized membrane protein